MSDLCPGCPIVIYREHIRCPVMQNKASPLYEQPPWQCVPIWRKDIIEDMLVDLCARAELDGQDIKTLVYVQEAWERLERIEQGR